MGQAAGLGGEFFDRHFAAARLALTDVPITSSRINVVFEGGSDWFGFAAGHDAVWSYSINGTRAGAVVGQLDVAAFFESHVGFVVGFRDVAVPKYQGDRLTIRAWILGLRVRQQPSRP